MPIRLTPGVKALLVACFAIFILQQTVDQFFGGNFLNTFGLVPGAVVFNFHIWQLFTYSFLHADVLHVFFNLMMLAFIGAELEQTWGTARFLRFYFFCTTVAAVCYILLALIFRGGMGVPMVGASGGIYGLLMAYGLIYGERVMLFMMLFPLKAKHFVWVLAGIEFLSTVFSGRSGIASIAHLGGMGAGFAYIWGKATWIVMQKRRQQGTLAAQRGKRLKKSSHLKLVKGDSDDGTDGGPGGGNDHRQDPRTWH